MASETNSVPGPEARHSLETRLQNALKRTLPMAHLQTQVLPECRGLKLALINPDFPTGPLPAEVMHAVVATPAYWAFCWGSGLALARYILANPERLAGLRVLDLGSGSGVVGIAAAMAGASSVTACDTDVDAQLATRHNAALNGVSIDLVEDFTTAEAFDLVLMADVLYDKANLPLLQLAQRAGKRVWVADSRMRELPVPGFELRTRLDALTLPNLGEFDEFGTTRIWSTARPVTDRTTEHCLALGPGEHLYYWTLGDPPQGHDRPVLIMLHGMRDVGRCMLPIAAALSDHFYCVMPDLRGHGKSHKPGAYAIEHFLMDLRRLQQHINAPEVHLLGHSLGGHIAARYAALYPNEVKALIIVEGLGPPRWQMPEIAELTRLATQLEAAIQTAAQAHTPRLMNDLTEAAARLKKNNPRLQEDWAAQLARWGTRQANDGKGLFWAFDPRAQEVFLGLREAQNFAYWQAITARTLVVTGDLGHIYWRELFPASTYTGRFSAAELQERLDALSSEQYRAQHRELAGAGHQVHYDQPQALARVSRQFLIPTTDPE